MDQADNAGRRRDLADILREAGIDPSSRGGRRRRADVEPDEVDEPDEVVEPDEAAEAVEPDADRPGTTVEAVEPIRMHDTAPLRRVDILPTVLHPPPAASADSSPDATSERAGRVENASRPTDFDSATGSVLSMSPTTADQPAGPADRADAAEPYEPAESEPTPSAPEPAGQLSPEPVAEPTPEPAAEPTPEPAAPTSTAQSSHAVSSGERTDTEPVASGAWSWAILVMEVVAAVAIGVGAWYAFTALWELVPYVAAFAGPLIVTLMVAVAGALRARTGRDPLGLPTLLVLVLAGMVLVVLPAATVITTP